MGSREATQSHSSPPRAQQSSTTTKEDEGTCYESAQSALEQDHREDGSSPPSSSCSSISSLTLEGYDIEEPFDDGSSRLRRGRTKLGDGEPSSSPVNESDHAIDGMPAPEERFSATANTDREEVSPAHDDADAITPPRGNLHRDRSARRHRRSLISKRENDKKSPSGRTVSFSPVVDVCRIPRKARRKESLSSEGYVYIMLFAVAIAIAAFSFLPAHPSLSPIYTMTRGEILSRAENMLSSQWDVEL